MHVSRQFLRFCIVGTIGFVVDAGSLYLIMATTGAGPYLARLFSFMMAASATWILNRNRASDYVVSAFGNGTFNVVCAFASDTDGNILRGILNKLGEIEREGPVHGEFVRVLRDLARGFQFDAMKEVLRKSRNAL